MLCQPRREAGILIGDTERALGQGAGQRVLAKVRLSIPQAVTEALDTSDAQRQAFSAIRPLTGQRAPALAPYRALLRITSKRRELHLVWQVVGAGGNPQLGIGRAKK